MQQWLKMECVSVDARGVATVRMAFERVAMTMAMGPMTMEYDSALPPRDGFFNRQMGSALGAMVGAQLEADIDANGKCLAMRGIDEMFDKLMGDLPGAAQIRDMLKGAFTEDQIKEQWFRWYRCREALPETRMQVGHVWTDDQSMNFGPLGEVNSKTKHKLLGVEDYQGRRCAKIVLTANLDMASGGPGVSNTIPGLKSMKMTSTGGTGLIYWDIDGERLASMVQSIPMEMTIEIGDPEGSDAESMKMVQQMTMTTTMEVLDKMPPAPTTQAAGATPSSS